ncbi:MAG: class I tRNA ligase family protein, partial [Alphaproteobacteria bacterium]|nr:class I tRNA ligase family protein [Alphaproteobacteria bacterium]
MLDKHYQPETIEAKIYLQWETENCFAPEENSDKPSYSIVIPPPNVTGNLHIGHALNNTLQDILVRYHRMAGYNCLWLPGTDHAGIATQSLVERQLTAENTTRHQMGREKFIDRVWQWKAHSGGNILNQIRRIGASVDWSRERFTMDEGLSHAVLQVFVTLYNDGLIYKDTRLVNWDPVLETAISDLEVQQQETNGHLWHIR